jgi:hypothetical protein
VIIVPPIPTFYDLPPGAVANITFASTSPALRCSNSLRHRVCAYSGESVINAPSLITK